MTGVSDNALIVMPKRWTVHIARRRETTSVAENSRSGRGTYLEQVLTDDVNANFGIGGQET